MKVKVSDVVAKFFADRGVRHVFGIVGSGNAHLFDSVYRTEGLEMVCVHHEQAACMAMQTYYRMTGKVTATYLTTGAGSTNGVTGVVSAWADSIPGLVISGNEHSKHVRADNPLRMYGIQGYDSTAMVSKVTKYVARVSDPAKILYELEKAHFISTHGRPGPCWVDVPMNIQSSMVEEGDLARFSPDELPGLPHERLAPADLESQIDGILAELRGAKRPVIWLGHGIRLAGGQPLVAELMERVPAAYLITWSAIDMVDSDHPRLFGRAGNYGQRCANFVLQNADYLLTIGTRLAIPQIGYELPELARAAKVSMVDIDPTELDKFASRFERRVCADAKVFLEKLLGKIGPAALPAPAAWLERCEGYRARYPWVGPEHADAGGFINSYRFMDRLLPHFKPDQVVTTDMGTALLSGHQVLRLKPGQRLMTSLGLGEMGFGLPAAIGASFARGGGEVLCLNCDGGMMMNLQELQTMAHHRLPIKLVIFNNDGYLMIKHTQKAIAAGRYSGSDKKSGVTCPDFSKLAAVFGFPAKTIRTWEDFDRVIPWMQAEAGPCIVEVFMSPEQFSYPKLSLAIKADGSLVSPPLEDLSPLLPLETLKAEMLVPVHEKSMGLSR
ncbi:MAG: thiamine pyrophosphate-binding protein [Spirochaetes bacterium]|nr:thiamine pyrophosphate-binding protein [Spirochaetota bacterium]